MAARGADVFTFVFLSMLVLPLGCIGVEYAVLHTSSDLVALTGKWFTFWTVGVRLGVAGLRQALNPGFTAQDIFGLTDKAAHQLVQELGFGNLAISLIGALSLLWPGWTAPAACAGGVFFTLAGLKHAAHGGRNLNQNVAMVSDLFGGVVLLAFVTLTIAMTL